jgi:hypothetical protein
VTVADILGVKDLIAILFIGFVVLVLVFMGRRISLTVKGVTASVERAAGNAEHAAKQAASKAVEVAAKVEAAHSEITDVKQTIGETNGNGDLLMIVTRLLEGQGQQLRWQEVHGAEDMAQMKTLVREIELMKLRIRANEQLLDGHTPVLEDIQERLAEQRAYLSDRMHKLANMAATNYGFTRLMWDASEIGKKHGPIPEMKNLLPWEYEPPTEEQP